MSLQDEHRLSRYYMHHRLNHLLRSVPAMIREARKHEGGVGHMFAALVHMHGPEPPPQHTPLGPPPQSVMHDTYRLLAEQLDGENDSLLRSFRSYDTDTLALREKLLSRLEIIRETAERRLLRQCYNSIAENMVMARVIRQGVPKTISKESLEDSSEKIQKSQKNPRRRRSGSKEKRVFMQEQARRQMQMQSAVVELSEENAYLRRVNAQNTAAMQEEMKKNKKKKKRRIEVHVHHYHQPAAPSAPSAPLAPSATPATPHPLFPLLEPAIPRHISPWRRRG